MPEVRTLSIELSKKAEDELGESSERIAQCLEAIRAWLAKSPHIKARTDDQFLLAFIRGCKFSLERVKEKLDLYYSLRNAIPEIYKNRHPKLAYVQELMRLGVVVPLPKTETPDGPRVIIIRPGSYDAEKYAVLDTFKVSTMMSEIMMREDDNLIIAGQVTVLDLKGVSFPLFLQMTPSTIKKMTVIGQDAQPIRVKSQHYINTPPTFQQVYNIFRTFMNEKNKQRQHVHGDDMDALFRMIPQKLFPTEYGGGVGSIESIVDYWVKKIDSYADYFEEEETEGYGTNEKKRVGRPKNAEAMFGLEGSFRQLNID